MILLRWQEGYRPEYQTEFSSCADLRARTGCVIKAKERAKVPTGVWIDRVIWERVPFGCVPEIQVRARSGLAYKFGITLTNGIGTIDADYPDEICVLLSNNGDQDFTVESGDRIAQILLSVTYRFPDILTKPDSVRIGGFGSTS